MSVETARSNFTETIQAKAVGYAWALRISARSYFTIYSPSVLALAVLPRVLLQVAFISYLAYYAGGDAGRTFAFIGASCHIMTMATVSKGADAILDERILGTLFRVRLGVLTVPGTIAARWLIYAAEGTCASLAAILVLSVPMGGTDLLLRLLAAFPLVILLALTTSAFGLAVGSFALSYRADVLIVNLAMYALLLFCGVAAPTTAFAVGGVDLTRGLPLTNGLLAVRDAVAGRSWVGHAALEVVVGAAWVLVAVLLLMRQDRRGRKLGTDDLL